MKHGTWFAAVMLLVVALLQSCASTTSSTMMWTPPEEATVGWSRPGRVEWVREEVVRRDGNPAAGAAAGAVIGALLGGRGPGAFFGAAGGAAVGAAASEGHSETRRYDVMVRFNDGYEQMFYYGGASPFRPGEVVVLTAQGLRHG